MGQLSPCVGQNRDILAELTWIRPNLAQLQPNLAELATWPNLGRKVGPGFAQYCPNRANIWPTFGQHRAMFGQLDRRWPTRPALANIGEIGLADAGQMMTEFRSNSANLDPDWQRSANNSPNSAIFVELGPKAVARRATSWQLFQQLRENFGVRRSRRVKISGARFRDACPTSVKVGSSFVDVFRAGPTSTEIDRIPPGPVQV